MCVSVCVAMSASGVCVNGGECEWSVCVYVYVCVCVCRSEEHTSELQSLV